MFDWKRNYKTSCILVLLVKFAFFTVKFSVAHDRTNFCEAKLTHVSRRNFCRESRSRPLFIVAFRESNPQPVFFVFQTIHIWKQIVTFILVIGSISICSRKMAKRNSKMKANTKLKRTVANKFYFSVRTLFKNYFDALPVFKFEVGYYDFSSFPGLKLHSTRRKY